MPWTSQRALFKDRVDAGRALAARLKAYAGRDDVVVLGLPRGGVPVAEQVALALDAPLDVLLVRKLGLPGHEELAMGAIASGGVVELDEGLCKSAGIPASLVRDVVRRETVELGRREALYREGRPRHDLHRRVVILVDDGLATGATMSAATRALRLEVPARVVIAVPVASREACEELTRSVADECVCFARPEPFIAVGIWYENFDQTSDAEVIACLDRSVRAEGQRTHSTGKEG